MKILIDDCMSSLWALSGIGHQGYNLWRHLRAEAQCDITDYRYLKAIPGGARWLVYTGAANLEMLRSRYDLIHYQNYFVPPLHGRSKKVVTIHDFGTFRLPKIAPLLHTSYNKLTIKNALKRADGIVVPSQFTKDELLNLFPSYESDSVFPCVNGIRDVFLTGRANVAAIRSLGLTPSSYFFFPGVLTKRKNLEFLLRTFITAKKDRKLENDTALVLVGKHAWDTHEIESLFNGDYGVHQLGYVSDEELVSLYRFCKALVFPSLYEGYGIPLIEAMSQGTPILASAIPTTVELNQVHNNQMFLFELGNQEQLISLFRELDQSADSIRKAIQYGDLSPYHFDAVARQHLAVYTRVMAEGA
jgi:glycosyltransferase involved in cell wall biosynthesis